MWTSAGTLFFKLSCIKISRWLKGWYEEVLISAGDSPGKILFHNILDSVLIYCIL